MFNRSATGSTQSPSATTAATTAADVANSTAEPVTAKKDVAAPRDAEDADDTMRNLRKTFAGIFGDM